MLTSYKIALNFAVHLYHYRVCCVHNKLKERALVVAVLLTTLSKNVPPFSQCNFVAHFFYKYRRMCFLFSFQLQLMCVVEDEKVSIDELCEQIQEFEDYVQSVDISSMSKI